MPACQTTQQLYHIPTALFVCGPLEPCALLVPLCLEQPVLYRFTSLHCMSPSFVQRVHPSVCAHAPFMPSLSRLLTCAVNTPYLSSISLHLRGRSFMSSAYPPSTQRVCSSLCTIFLVPMPSLHSVTLLPRLSLSFGLSVSYPPFYPMPQHTHVLPLHTAYRT